MRILDDSVWPWLISVLIGMFIIWDFIAVAAAARIYSDWYDLTIVDYLLAYSLILPAGLTVLWVARCAFRRKWAFIAVSLGTSVFIPILAYLIFIGLIVAFKTDF